MENEQGSKVYKYRVDSQIESLNALTIDQSIKIFSKFLNLAWSTAQELLVDREYTSDINSVSDWLQVNWEILVERKVLPLNNYLEVYGEGGDFYGSSSRITDKDSLPNYRVKVTSINDAVIYDILNKEEFSLHNYTFDRLVGFKDDFYLLEPDFDFVLITDDNSGIERVVQLKEVKFELQEVERPN